MPPYSLLLFYFGAPLARRGLSTFLPVVPCTSSLPRTACFMRHCGVLPEYSTPSARYSQTHPSYILHAPCDPCPLPVYRHEQTRTLNIVTPLRTLLQFRTDPFSRVRGVDWSYGGGGFLQNANRKFATRVDVLGKIGALGGCERAQQCCLPGRGLSHRLTRNTSPSGFTTLRKCELLQPTLVSLLVRGLPTVRSPAVC